MIADEAVHGIIVNAFLKEQNHLKEISSVNQMKFISVKYLQGQGIVNAFKII